MDTISEVKGNVTTQNFIEQINANNKKTNKNFEEIETKLKGDYVVEQGTSDIWTWEKWNSGTFKMWGMVTVTYVDPSILMKERINFPVELVENAIGFATVNDYASPSISSTKTPIILCKTNRCSVQVHNHLGNFTSTSTANVAVQVIGKWK